MPDAVPQTEEASVTQHDADDIPTTPDPTMQPSDEWQVPDSATVAHDKATAIRQHKHDNELEEARNTRREPNPLDI